MRARAGYNAKTLADESFRSSSAATVINTKLFPEAVEVARQISRPSRTASIASAWCAQSPSEYWEIRKSRIELSRREGTGRYRGSWPGTWAVSTISNPAFSAQFWTRLAEKNSLESLDIMVHLCSNGGRLPTVPKREPIYWLAAIVSLDCSSSQDQHIDANSVVVD